ncbi:MAG: hypothetical protein H6Q90_3481 [Deltaproteobacteria bacterium]|nr:hypothetical protein [Deltaproteobacteria bacterium]
MRKSLAYIVLALVVPGCMSFKVHQALPPTAWILVRAQGSMQQESDYEMARQAIPGALKTVEGFWYVANGEGGMPEVAGKLAAVLTEGYCQYGTAFVEDDWEAAKFKKDLDAIDYHNSRATQIFTRCLNYALHSLGSRWEKEIYGTTDVTNKLIHDAGPDQRTPMMFAGMALGSIINHNMTRTEMLALLPAVKAIMERVIELDLKRPPANKQLAALPYIALGMINSSAPKAMGGDPDKARQYFETALKITDNKFLLARTLMAFQVGTKTNDQKYFHDQLKLVLETAPSVWPEQRLANEVAHRKARRYLSKEKELF